MKIDARTIEFDAGARQMRTAESISNPMTFGTSPGAIFLPSGYQEVAYPWGVLASYTAKEDFPSMENIKLAIDGMHCDACVRRVTNALSGVQGVRVDSVEVGSASVGFDPAAVAPEQIAAAVDKIGFKAHVER